MEYSESAYGRLLEEIFRRFPSVQKTDFAAAYKPGLEGMESFCAALGHPERAFRSIHIAGTNGKGSVASLLASALSSVGLKTGLYTSPHLLDFRERARIIPGRESYGLIPKAYVFEFLSAWKPYFEEHNLSFFEITTGLAFKWFADEGVDVAVIETGLGGRLDSTNVLTPELAVVTTIGLDHCAQLGDTLEAIAGEKAGIFKPGIPALVGESDPETDPVFDDKAWMNCPLTYADRVRPSLWHRRQEILRKMDLQATVQEKNLRTVLAAVDILREIPGFKALSDVQAVLDGIIHAARRTGFRGRWERLSDLPFVLADIGHNPQALRYSFDQLRHYVEEGRCSSLIIVYGVMADKDLDSILPLMPVDATYIFTAPDTPRALPAAEILKRYTAVAKNRPAGSPPVRAFEVGAVRQAVQMAVQLAQNVAGQPARSASAVKPAPPLVFIGGSAFVVAEALPLFR
ncbi:MAG: bifunctional folylpolyglutamate synthase/dihydrofolate synthase [Bacteroidales bacterium]|nr:bifunctional folylpolyglutamate synthase/dihydrofolate synthase [Bacteroidales bacterium]